MKNYRKGSYTVYDIKYHFVWITKYRYHVLQGVLAIRVRDLIREVCIAQDSIILKGVVSKDYIHVLVSCRPTISPSKLVQFMKGKSSYKLQQEFPELKKKILGPTYMGQRVFLRIFR